MNGAGRNISVIFKTLQSTRVGSLFTCADGALWFTGGIFVRVAAANDATGFKGGLELCV